ncbi:MAG: hypothetical protein JXB47_12270 [Anaerolineae bacterium]|nr:hypothetical protein [Anaerolineae bacterium]
MKQKHFLKTLLATAMLTVGLISAPGALAQEAAEIHLYSSDAAPTNGTLEIYTSYNYGDGALFQPEGSLMATIPVSAGQPIDAVLSDYPHGVNVRVWFVPDDGQPSLLPSQHYPAEFGTAAGGEDNLSVYMTSFAGAIPAVSNVLAGDLPNLPGEVVSVELDDGVTEWGYWDSTNEQFVTLGWTWWNGSTLNYAAVKGGPVTEEQLARIINGTGSILSGGVLQSFYLEDKDVTEWGYWVPGDDSDDEDPGAYILLGWSQENANGTVKCATPGDGLLTPEELCKLAAPTGN